MSLRCVVRWILLLFSIPVIGTGWLLLAGATLSAALFHTPHTLLFLPLPDNPQALWLLAALLALRGALAVLATARYRQWFRVGSVSTDGDKSARVLWLSLCTATWLSLAHWGDITLPDWLIVWGILGWGWLLLPFIDWDNNNTANAPDIMDSFPSSHETYNSLNPASGLPMVPYGSADIAGNLYGSSSIEPFSSINSANGSSSSISHSTDPVTGLPL